MHLAARPQINLRSVGRKRFAHLADGEQDEIHVEANVPWGEDTLFTLEFREEENKYAVHTCNNRYLQTDGKLAVEANKVCTYRLLVLYQQPYWYQCLRRNWHIALLKEDLSQL